MTASAQINKYPNFVGIGSESLVTFSRLMSKLGTCRNYNNDKVEGKGKGERERKGERGRESSKLDPKHQRYRLGHKMGHSAHCRVLLF